MEVCDKLCKANPFHCYTVDPPNSNIFARLKKMSLLRYVSLFGYFVTFSVLTGIRIEGIEFSTKSRIFFLIRKVIS